MKHCVAVLMVVGIALATVGRAGPYSDVILGESPVSYWTFDESSSGTGTAYDAVGNNDGTFTGTAARTSGLIGAGAARFNTATGDGVNVGNGGGDFSFTAGMSVEAIIKPDANLGSIAFQEVFRKEDGGNRILFSFQSNGSILSFGINDGGGYSELDMPLDGKFGRPTLADFKDGKPHHIAATYDTASGYKAIYLDGTARFSTIRTAGVNMVSGGTALAIIGNTTSNVEPFSGAIDEVALYGNALGATTVFRHALASGADVALRLSTDVLGPGRFPNGYNNNAGESTVELIRFIANSNASPINVAYTQNPADIIDFSPFVVAGNTAGDWGSDTHGRGGNIWIPADGEVDEPHEGFGCHVNKFITFDLDDIRDVWLGGTNELLMLTGSAGVNGNVPTSMDPPNATIQSAIWLDGQLLDASPLISRTGLSYDFQLLLPPGGHYLTMALLNGEGTSSVWDDAAFRDVRLQIVPEPATLVLLGAGIVALARRRRRGR